MAKKMQLTIKAKPPKIPAKRIQEQKLVQHPGSLITPPIPHPSQRYHTHPPLPSKTRVGDRKPPTMTKRPKVKVRNKKPYGGK